MSDISAFHAHLYYDAGSLDKATRIADKAGELFDLVVGRKHEKAVGPHPMWSCQLAFKKIEFGNVIPWLSENREGLTVFIHGCSGDDVKDHTDYAIWMGSIEPLKLDIFR